MRQVISAGYAAGLDPALPAGALFLAENYCDPCLLAAAQASLKGRAWTGRLATSPAVLETVRQKADFACRTGAIAADMETAAIAALCQERGVPLLSLRVISDTAREELAVPFSVCFDAEHERPRPLALAGFLLRHPSRLRGFIRFATAIGRARMRLAQALVEVVTPQDRNSLSAGVSGFKK